MSNRLYNQFSYSPERQPINLMGKFTQAVANVQATLLNQAVTYTAISRGTAGNAVTVRLIDPGVDGALAVVVTGTAIVVTLAYSTGAVTTTASQLVTAINGSGAAALVTASGSGSSPLAALAVTHLAGGIDAVVTTNALRMSMTQTATGTYILQLEDEFPELLSCDISILSASAKDIAPQIVSAATAFGTAKQIIIRTIKMTDQSLVSLGATNAMYIHLILRNSTNP